VRHVVVTGAAAGLGRVTAERFLAAGDRVYVCDITATGVTSLRTESQVALALVVDVSDRLQVDKFFDAIAELTGRVDVLINNVGVAGPIVPVEEVPPQQWTATLDANLNGAFWAIRRVLPAMKAARGGTILNVSTFSVRTLPEWRAPYIVAKAALESLSLVVAREAGPYNIRCNAVRPGAMDNDRLARVIHGLAERTGRSPREVEEELLRYVSMRSKVSMGEVAGLLEFLASDSAAHITSQIIAIDAGAQWEA
jgi:NAD(P)-dependent dehydrogenase (short-subunit alcohol dehydrogenase family)